MRCLDMCKQYQITCPNRECRLWIDSDSEFNCVKEAVDKNGPMPLREVAKRLNISFVRVKQIEDHAKQKLKKHLK